MAKYKLQREKYERYGSGGIVNSTFNAENDEEALCKVLEHCMYGVHDEEDREPGDEGFVMPTKEQLLDRIYNSNGDGCDYILRLENADTGEVLIESEDYSEGEEEW